MRLSAPTAPIFIVAVALAVLALLALYNVVHIPGVQSFWLMTSAFAVLVLGNVLKGV